MKNFLKDWCDKASQTGIGQMLKMAKTLQTHASGILAYADHPITSGRMEGINNKIKTLPGKPTAFMTRISSSSNSYPSPTFLVIV